MLKEEERLEKFREYVKSVKGLRSEVISSLHKGQEEFGYISEIIKKIIMEETKVSIEKINEIVKHNGLFIEQPRGKYHIGVCLGETCCKKGAKELLIKIKKNLKIEVGEKTTDGVFSLEILRCIGACGLAPAIIVNKEIYGGEQVKNIEKFLDNYR